MERWETVYFDILCRLQDICSSMNIDMWLAGQAALSAFRYGRLADNEVSVYVDAKHAVRLAEALNAEADECFGAESMLSNDRYPRFEIRVFDPRTTDCDTAEFFRIDNNCMHVTVQFLQRPVDKKSLKNRITNKIFKSVSGAALYRHNAQLSASGGSSVNAAGHSFKGKIFSEKQEVSLYDRSFYIPHDTDAFFTSQFGPGWEYYEADPFVSGDKHFRSTEISWKEWSAGISAQEISSYEKLLKDYRRESAGNRSLTKEIDRVYDVTACCCDKIGIYKDFFNHENNLSEMLGSGDYDGLGRELLPYLKGLKKYADLGLDFYIDDTLTETADALFRHRGQDAFADKIRALIPAGKEPVSLTDYRGQVKEFSPDSGLSPAQQTLLALMKRVDEFLREHGIEYFLFGGSLLGAIRHDGFIPWDDDMDIVMTRDNYHKLVSLSDELPWDDITFDCYEKNREFTRPFGMFTLLTDTRFVKTRVFMGGAGMGTGIDVFVMDNVPWEHLDEYLKDSLLYQEIQSDSFINNGRILEYRDEYFACKDREAETGKVEETLRLQGELEKYGPEKAGDLRVVRLWFNRPRIYEPGMMADPVMHRFEDTEFPVPERAVECLEMQYGRDWNVVPEEADRDEHAFRIDHDVSARDYYRLIDSYVDWQHISEVQSKRKQNRIRVLDKTMKLDEFRKHLASACNDYGKNRSDQS